MLHDALQEQEAMGHRSELDRLRQQREELSAMLGQKRESVSLHAADMVLPSWASLQG